MRNLLKMALALIVTGEALARASVPDTIGMTLLQATTTNLNGAGIRVAQPEADDAGTPPYTNTWEVRGGSVNDPTNLFTYYNGNPPFNNANTFTNSLGLESGHAEFVAGYFYGTTNGVGYPYGFTHGVATNVSHVDNYQADTFINDYVVAGLSIPARIVNQSFTFGVYSATDDQFFDNYAAQNGVLFVSGVSANGNPVWSPGTCYNGIGVGSSDAGDSPKGPTPDGRSKPDITAPGPAETSYTTPQVAGAAAILLQAGLRGDGGGDINSAANIRTLKALLLNGAVKLTDWTNSPSQPLHFRYGAGVLNVFNSYKQLCGGKRTNFVFATVFTNAAHPPIVVTNSISALSAWNFTNITSSATNDGVHHYFFNVTNATSNATFTAVTTLVWNRQNGQSAINNLNLFLYNTANSNLVMCSTSAVDNVEHIFLPKLAQGRYDLQVWKAGGSGIVSASETYALAWEFFSESATLAKSGTNAVLSWPVYPAGFAIAATANLTSPNWSTNSLPPPIFTNGQNLISIPETNAAQFFRLQMPNF
jgi:Subtilase family